MDKKEITIKKLQVILMNDLRITHWVIKFTFLLGSYINFMAFPGWLETEYPGWVKEMKTRDRCLNIACH